MRAEYYTQEPGMQPNTIYQICLAAILRADKEYSTGCFERLPYAVEQVLGHQVRIIQSDACNCSGYIEKNYTNSRLRIRTQ